MAEDRNNPDMERNAGTNVGDEGGQNRQAPGRNPDEDQSTGQRGGQGGDRRDQNQGDTGRGQGQEQSGFEKGGQGGQNR